MVLAAWMRQIGARTFHFLLPSAVGQIIAFQWWPAKWQEDIKTEWDWLRGL